MKKLKITSLILAVLMIVSMLPLGMVSAFAAEIASQPDYKIGTADEFVTFINNWYGEENYYTGKTVALTADIDLTSTTLPDIKADKNSFTGTFDGQGHKIIGYDMIVPYGNNNHGVFGSTVAAGDSATIKNVEIALAFEGQAGGTSMAPHASSGPTTTWGMGGLYGYISGSLTLENIKITGTTHGRSIGGIAQSVAKTAVVNMTNVDVGTNIGHHWSGQGGGFFGEVATGAKIYAEGCVYSGVYSYLCTDMGTDAPPKIGGFIGVNNSNDVTFVDCEMSGTVISYLTVINYKKDTTTMNAQEHYIGGFVGQNKGQIAFTDSVVSGTVKANVDATVDTSAASKDTVAPHVGGFVAHNTNATSNLSFDGCTMSGSVITTHVTGAAAKTWAHVGGFVANSYAPVTFTDSVMSGALDSAMEGGSDFGGNTGGFMGQAANTATFKNCTMLGTVSAAMNGTPGVGGFVGFAQGGQTLTFTDCAMGGVVNTIGTAFLGGFLGTTSVNPVVITGSVMFGQVTTSGAATTGGFFGQSTKAMTMTDCVMIGNVVSTYSDGTSDGADRTDRLAGIGGYVKGTMALTNVVFYGGVRVVNPHKSSAFATGFISGCYPTANANNFKGCIYAGNVYGASASTRPTYINSGSPSGIYNVQIGGAHNGPAVNPNALSKYTMAKSGANVSTPYGLKDNKTDWNSTSLSQKNYAASIAGLTTSTTANTEAFETEKAEYKAYLEANYDLTAGLPVPKGVSAALRVITLKDEAALLNFAQMIQNGAILAGFTVKLESDVTLNDGWTASATAPTTAWPLTSAGKFFAGTFDGQGHTVSGIYLKTTGGSVGIFGNVPQWGTATVKNVAIVNSYVTSNGQGLGGIFGEVQNELNSTDAPVAGNAAYVNKTKAVIDNVYANMQVINTNTSKNNSNLGTGGFVGGARADVSITNSAFVGVVDGGYFRGTSAFVGAIRPLEATWNETKGQYFRTVLTVENCYAQATLKDKWGCVAGVVGYSNACTTHNITNVILNNTITTDAAATSGYLFGLNWWAGNNPLKGGDNKDYQYWNLEDVYYIETECTKNDGTTQKLYPIGNASSGGSRLNNNDSFNLGKTKEYTDVEVGGDASAMGLAPTAMTELPAVLYAWDLQMSVTLTDDLAINLYADEAYTVLNDAGVASVDVTKKNGEVKFTYNDILPQQIGDKFVVELGASDVAVNVKDYLVALLDTDAQDVAADLLRYGAAAQVKANYNVDALVTDGVALEGLGTSFDAAAMEVVAPVTANKKNIVGVALRLENALALVAKDAEGNVIATTSLNADQMDKNITLTAEDGSTVEVSVAWYVQQALNGGVDEQVDLDLIAAIYAYGLSAAAYNA